MRALHSIALSDLPVVRFQLMLTLQLLATVASAQSTNTEDVRERRAVAALIADLAVRGVPVRALSAFDSAGAEVRRVQLASRCEGVEVFQVRMVNVADLHPYIVVRTPRATVGLGGFQSPEPVAALSALVAPNGRSCLSSDELARLLDPHGMDAIIETAVAHTELVTIDVLARWRAVLDARDWPRDTSVTLRSGLRIDRVSVISRSVGSGPQWIPIAYSFVFDKHGRLSGWARLLGEALHP